MINVVYDVTTTERKKISLVKLDICFAGNCVYLEVSPTLAENECEKIKCNMEDWLKLKRGY